MSYPAGMIVRHDLAARFNHWITAACFVLLMLSGLSMFHPLLFWLSGLFGGGQWARAVHPWIGIVLLLSYGGMIVQFWRDNLPSRNDVEWSMQIGKVLLNEEEGVPEVSRFNAGQKAVFWSMSFLIPVLFFTGLLIWEVYFGSLTSIPVQRVAVLIHSLAAIMAILVLLIHVYAAFWIKGTLHAMTEGTVSPGWAYRHHRKWFRSLVATGSRGPLPNPPQAHKGEAR